MDPQTPDLTAHPTIVRVQGWDHVTGALSNADLSSSIYAASLGLQGRYGPILTELDGAAHHEFREAVNSLFNKSACAFYLEEAVIPIIDSLIEKIAPNGSADLIGSLCQPFPSLVIATMMGLAPSTAAEIDAIARVVSEPDEPTTVAASDDLRDRLLPVIARRRASPGGRDLITRFTECSPGGRALDDIEVYSLIRLIGAAGTETLHHATANLLVGVLSDDAQLEAIKTDRALIARAVDESLRWECPATAVPRAAEHATAIGDDTVPSGSIVLCDLRSANHDTARWESPADFNLFRPRRAHVGFGLGVHACLGVHLSRMVMAYVLEALLTVLPTIELDTRFPAPSIEGSALRFPRSIPVRWT